MTSSSNVVKVGFDRSWLTRLVDRIRSWNDRRIAVRQLSAMSDRLLQDIGIERYEISDAVNKPAGLARLVPAPEISEKIAEIKQAA